MYLCMHIYLYESTWVTYCCTLRTPHTVTLIAMATIPPYVHIAIPTKSAYVSTPLVMSQLCRML